MHRRNFLATAATLVTLAPRGLAAASPPARPSRRKGFMLPSLRGDPKQKTSLADQFRLIRDAGFAGVEVRGSLNQREVLAARDASGLQIPSVVVAAHWTHPLTSPNPATRAVGLEGLLQAIRDAKAYGADSVLLVPGVVSKEIAYNDAYARAVAEIHKAVPLAESLGVVIAIENVWNKFLLSPLEAAAFVDAFKSPWVRWHFDVGNVVETGFPEQWIPILGARIVKVHVKEYSLKLRDERGPRAGFEAGLMTGDSDWPAVLKALDAIGYAGWMITEQYRPPGLTDAAWLERLSGELDRVLAL
jgi:L-ribulose-5-phosphate 3-epimerase